LKYDTSIDEAFDVHTYLLQRIVEIATNLTHFIYHLYVGRFKKLYRKRSLRVGSSTVGLKKFKFHRTKVFTHFVKFEV
jgi:hypothetical protein